MKRFKIETDALYRPHIGENYSSNLRLEVLNSPNGALGRKFSAESFDAKLSCLSRMKFGRLKSSRTFIIDPDTIHPSLYNREMQERRHKM